MAGDGGRQEQVRRPAPRKQKPEQNLEAKDQHNEELSAETERMLDAIDEALADQGLDSEEQASQFVDQFFHQRGGQ